QGEHVRDPDRRGHAGVGDAAGRGACGAQGGARSQTGEGVVSGGANREAVMKVFRGDASGGKEVEYQVPVEPGMVVLDAIHWIQAHQAPDLAVRWNCKAAKCGSCSAEVNGKPALMCKSRMEHFEPGKPISVRPIKTFPTIS